MNTSERDELFAALAELARRHPHWRVGQLVANVAGWADADVWDVEDEQLLAAVRGHLAATDGLAVGNPGSIPAVHLKPVA